MRDNLSEIASRLRDEDWTPLTPPVEAALERARPRRAPHGWAGGVAWRWAVPATVAALVVAVAGAVALSPLGRQQSIVAAPSRAGNGPQEVTFAEVTLRVPVSWVVDPVARKSPSGRFQVSEWAEAACVHPAGTRGDNVCVGGVLIQRATVASAADEHVELTPSSGLVCGELAPVKRGWGFSSSSAVKTELDSRPATRSAFTFMRPGTFGVRDDGRPVDPADAYASYETWTVVSAQLLLQADASSPEAVAAATSARIADADGPTTKRLDAQGHGVTFAVPLDWSDWTVGAMCLYSPDATLTCPVDGITVHGQAWFTGKGDAAAGTGGPVTPAPDSALGYVPTDPKVKADIPAACGRGHRASNVDAVQPSRRLTQSTTRQVGGEQAEYREWSATCPDGSTFTWRRWWFPQRQTMLDSYDTPGGLDPAAVDDIVSTIAWTQQPGSPTATPTATLTIPTGADTPTGLVIGLKGGFKAYAASTGNVCFVDPSGTLYACAKPGDRGISVLPTNRPGTRTVLGTVSADAARVEYGRGDEKFKTTTLTPLPGLLGWVVYLLDVPVDHAQDPAVQETVTAYDQDGRKL